VFQKTKEFEEKGWGQWFKKDKGRTFIGFGFIPLASHRIAKHRRVRASDSLKW
jgi:hypothetical protein